MLIKFLCNICGGLSEKDRAELGREDRSCNGCGSTSRWRSIVHCLSESLFGRPLTIANMPVDKSVVGMGLSDAKLYARQLAEKFSYTNTHYHKEPLLDITKVPDEATNSLDFLISTDVFEHIIHPVSVAFRNVHRMLKPTGVLVFSVPFQSEGKTQEWFPRLNQYSIVDFFGEQLLINRTKDDEIEVHRKLVFHGGSGDTLEMRLFSLPGIISELTAAGFHHIYILDADLPDWGLLNRGDTSPPLVAAKLPIRTESLRALQPASSSYAQEAQILG
jgi:SAM-dependent methyltransferase